jgi:hypothetical protein
LPVKEGCAQNLNLSSTRYPATGDRRADVMVWSPAGAAAAIELQHTSIGLDNIQSRTAAYIAANVAVAWVAFLAPRDLDEVRAAAEGWVIPRYAPRAWQLWAHGFALSQLAFYEPGEQQVWIGHFAPYYIEVPYSSWFTPDGDEESAGGYSRTSKRWRELKLRGPFRPEDMRIRRVHRKRHMVDGHFFPAALMAHLEPAEGALIQPFSPAQTSLEETGCRVFHERFGPGTVVDTERSDHNGIIVVVDFDTAGRKRVIDSFLKPV